MTAADRSRRAANLPVLGESRLGKTMLIRKFERQNGSISTGVPAPSAALWW